VLISSPSFLRFIQPADPLQIVALVPDFLATERAFFASKIALRSLKEAYFLCLQDSSALQGTARKTAHQTFEGLSVLLLNFNHKFTFLSLGNNSKIITTSRVLVNNFNAPFRGLQA